MSVLCYTDDSWPLIQKVWSSGKKKTHMIFWKRLWHNAPYSCSPQSLRRKRWTSPPLTLTTSELGIYFEQITKSPSMISGQWRTLLGYESSCPGRCVQNTWNEMPLSLCWPLKKLDDCFEPQAHICGGYRGKIQLSLQSFQQIYLPFHHIRESIRNFSTKFGLEKT